MTADIATYQRKVVELTAEVRRLQRELAEERLASRERERRLRAERDEGVAPQVKALSLALRAASADRDRAVRVAQELRRSR